MCNYRKKYVIIAYAYSSTGVDFFILQFKKATVFPRFSFVKCHPYQIRKNLNVLSVMYKSTSVRNMNNLTKSWEKIIRKSKIR